MREREAQRFFDRIGHDALRPLLGEVYRELAELRPLNPPQNMGSQQFPRPVLGITQAAAPAPSPAKVLKSGIEVIDLEA